MQPAKYFIDMIHENRLIVKVESITKVIVSCRLNANMLERKML